MSIRKRESKKAKNGYVYEVYFYYRENGIKTRYSKSGFLTKKEAQEHEALKLLEVQENGKVKKEVKKTFNDVFFEFLEVGANEYQANTIYNTKKDLKYFKDSIGRMIITTIDYSTLQKYFNSRSKEGMQTNKNIKKSMNRVFNYAIKVGYIKNNPISLVTIKGVDKPRNKEKVLLLDEFHQIINDLEQCNDFKYNAYSIAMQIGFYTGLRISEVLALEKKDFDLDNELISVNKKLFYKGLKKEDYYATEQMKSKKSKAIIPLAKVLKLSLIEWFKVNPYDKVICDIEGCYINPTVLSHDIKQIASKHDIEFNYHMLRHTFATNLVTSNIDIKTTQELMRHSNFNTTLSLYTHINDEHKKEAINSVFNLKSVENMSKMDIKKALN